MDCASSRGHHKCIRVLLEADAPVDPVDRSKVSRDIHKLSRTCYNKEGMENL